MKFIENALKNTIDHLGAKHLERPVGSFITGFKDQDNDGLHAALFLEGCDWQEVTPQAVELGVAFGDCRYFCAPVVSEEAYEAVALLGELDEEQLETVRVVKGYHGEMELTTSAMYPKETKVVHLITGTHEGNIVAFTWYPGRLTQPAATGLNDNTPVKLTRERQ